MTILDPKNIAEVWVRTGMYTAASLGGEREASKYLARFRDRQVKWNEAWDYGTVGKRQISPSQCRVLGAWVHLTVELPDWNAIVQAKRDLRQQAQEAKKARMSSRVVEYIADGANSYDILTITKTRIYRFPLSRCKFFVIEFRQLP